MNACYKLISDIYFLDDDFEKGGLYYNNGKGWIPIGNSEDSFAGMFDGNGHLIKGLRIDSEDIYVGLFGYSVGIIKSIDIVGSQIYTNCYNSSSFIGGIVGRNDGFISNAYNEGIVQGSSDGNLYDNYQLYAGGIAGYNIGTICSSCNRGTISETVSDSITGVSCIVGGIVGYNGYCGSITGNYNSGIIDCCVSGNNSVDLGGIVGCNVAGSVSDNYNCGNVTTTLTSSNTCAGGIVGVNNNNGVVTNSYNCGILNCNETSSSLYLGEIIGNNYVGTISNCYFAISNIKGIGSGTGIATECTIEEMKLQDTYAGFDFDTTWTMDGNAEYPYPELQAVSMIYEKPVASISIYSLPDKQTYALSDEGLVLTGGQITVNFEDGTTNNIDITKDMVSGYDNTSPGEKTITVTYRGSTTSFNS